MPVYPDKALQVREQEFKVVHGSIVKNEGSASIQAGGKLFVGHHALKFSG